MGVTNTVLFPFYKKYIKAVSPCALLGFTDNTLFEGDMYDLRLNNWNINSQWKLNRSYQTIICTRCAYFARDPEDFIIRCHRYLNPGGRLYVDWGVGEHWRYENFKIGWVKDGEHEKKYGDDNYLWSMVWDESFLENESCQEFAKAAQKYGYDDLKAAIYKEVPSVMNLDFARQYFDVNYHILTVNNKYLQMYVLLDGQCRK
jgi:SAM-dependent methyltransferase